MRFAIDAILAAIIIFCTLRGSKTGCINAGIAFLTMLIAFFGGLAISSAAAPSVAYPLRPFVAGVIDVEVEDKAAAAAGIDPVAVDDTIAASPELLRPYSIYCLEYIGLHEQRAEHYAPKAQRIYAEYDLDATTASAHAGAEAVAYATLSVVFFGLIILLISLIRQVFGLRFRITDNAEVDIYGGAAFGFLLGFLICTYLCWLLSFCGHFIGGSSLSDALFGRFFMLPGAVADVIF